MSFCLIYQSGVEIHPHALLTLYGLWETFHVFRIPGFSARGSEIYGYLGESNTGE